LTERLFVVKIGLEERMFYEGCGGVDNMFADFSKKEFVQTAVGATGSIIMGYLVMLGVLFVIS
jgi:hypothetical protein